MVTGRATAIRHPKDLGVGSQACGPVDRLPTGAVGLQVGGGLTDAEGVEGHPVTSSAPENPVHSEVQGGPAPLEVATSPVVVAAGLGPNGGAPRDVAVAPPVDGLDPAIPRLVRRPTPPLNGEIGEAGLVPNQVLPDGRRATPDETRVGVGRVEEARLTRPS